jgi:hypothetical protein
MVRSDYYDVQHSDIRTNAGLNNRCVAKGKFTLVSLVDGSELFLGEYVGEAADSFDKSTTKAQSVAYRIAMLLSFTSPLGPNADPEHDDRDGDAPPPDPRTKSVAGKPKAEKPKPDKAKGTGWAPDITESQRKWLLNKAGQAGYENEAEVFKVFGKITRANIQDVAAKLSEPEYQK